MPRAASHQRAETEWIVDDLSAAQDFIRSLNRKVVRQRFTRNSRWTPDHIVLAKRNGTTVAMADCITTLDEAGANAGLLAAPGYGGYAVLALQHLKRIVQVRHWESTLRVPTKATVAISRRYFHSTYDQGAWDIARELVKQFGPRPYLNPHPLLASRYFLNAFGLPSIERFDLPTRSQIIRVARDPGKLRLKSPDGQFIDAAGLAALAFDVVNLPMTSRQHVTRFLLLSFLPLYGLPIPETDVRAMTKPDEMSVFMNALGSAPVIEDLSQGLFEVVEQSEDEQASALSALKSLPRLR